MSKRQYLYNMAYAAGIEVVVSRTEYDQMKVAVHVRNPSLVELEQAIEYATNNGFPRVMIHTDLDWPIKN